MGLITVILILHLFFGLLIENIRSRSLPLLLGILVFALAVIFTAGITYNVDWWMYYYLFKYENGSTDFMFPVLTKLFKLLELPYADLYVFHIIGSLLLFSLLITRFTRNYFYVFLIYFLLDYVHFNNQIRYYFGFPVLMLGMYLLLHKRKYLFSVSFIILGLLFHKGLFMLLLFIPAYFFISTEKYIKTMLLLSAVLAVLIMVVVQFGIGLSLEHFDNYLGSEYEGSLVGGAFNALPYLIYFTFMLIEHRRITRKYPDLLKDKNNELLMKLSFFPLFFLAASFFLQILGHRYIMPFSIFWCIYYLNMIRGLPQKVRFPKMLLFSAVHFAALFSIYFLPDYFLAKNHFMKQLEMTVESIPYLKDLL
ncbi:MAG: EpsG family protein [Kaistella sp.]|nr:EpsG family protein [Kaistella sp.]